MMKPYYDHGGITIYHGDNRKILPLLDQKFDLLLTDPPYGIGENAHRVASRTKLAATTDYGSFDWDKEPADRQTIDYSVSICRHAVIWGGNYFHVPPSRGWLVWDKLNSGNFADCELAWTNLKMSVRKFTLLWNGMIRGGEQRGVKRVHPTQKPVELMHWCLSHADAKSVLDPWMGSGTTLVAAKFRGLKAVGIEINEQYCEIAAKRLSQEVLFSPEMLAEKQPEKTASMF